MAAKPEVPRKYGNDDFLKPESFRLRGKFDVPSERFIAFTQIHSRGAGETLYGWAGWTPLERVRALLAIDEQCEDQASTSPTASRSSTRLGASSLTALATTLPWDRAYGRSWPRSLVPKARRRLSSKPGSRNSPAE